MRTYTLHLIRILLQFVMQFILFIHVVSGVDFLFPIPSNLISSLLCSLLICPNLFIFLFLFFSSYVTDNMLRCNVDKCYAMFSMHSLPFSSVLYYSLMYYTILSYTVLFFSALFLLCKLNFITIAIVSPARLHYENLHYMSSGSIIRVIHSTILGTT